MLSEKPKKFEYIRLFLDIGDLSELNRLGSIGWHCVGLVDLNMRPQVRNNMILVLLERELV